MMQLTGNSTLITGVACGIGFAFAKAFVAEGARVAIADIDIDRTRIAAAVKIDVTDQNSIDAGVVETVKAFGQIEILINNAAIFTAAPISKITRQNYQHGINVNAIAPGVVGGEHWDGVEALVAKYEKKATGQKKKEVTAAVPFGRMGMADDLTGTAIFLASTSASYVVAQTYNVDGGNWMS
jgi:NAD(P)-dependent dehydrogenase (short-subunit alcohol dehydrogenase family)